MISGTNYRHLLSRAAAAAVALLLLSSANAADRPRDSDDADAAAAVEASAANASAPNARLAGLIDAGGEIIRKKGIDSVQRIDRGVYCIRPLASTNINVSTIIVNVSVDYYFSKLDEVTVQWAAKSNGCGNGRIGVYTFADTDGDGNYGFSNDVGFTIVVP